MRKQSWRRCLMTMPIRKWPSRMARSNLRRRSPNCNLRRQAAAWSFASHPNLKQWEGTPNDIVLRGGDTLVIPKAPNFVLVSGAVYDETAVTYRPGRSAKWYLSQAGGPTQLADKKSIFVVRADGSIVGGGSSDGLFTGSPLSAALRPGDMVVVPEKATGQNQKWKTLMETATTVSSVATSAAYRGQVLRNELGPVRRFGTKLFFSLIILAMLGTTLRAQNSDWGAAALA